MRPRGMLMALAFVLALVLLAWLTGDKSPLSDSPAPTPTNAPADAR